MVSSSTMDPAMEIRMVRDNLALAISFWTTVKKGLITPEHLPSGRAVVTSDAGKVVEVFNPLELKGYEDLVRCATNQIRCAFAFSVMQESNPDHQAARSAIYLLNNTMRRDMLVPVWACPAAYRQRFEVRPIDFVLDATGLDGKPVFWDDFGGLGKYLELLEYCETQIELLPPQPGRSSREAAEEGASLGVGFIEALARSDPMALFLSERCSLGPESRTIAGGLYSEYLDWCFETGREALGQRSFGMQLTKLGFTRRRRGRGRHWWEGIELAASAT